MQQTPDHQRETGGVFRRAASARVGITPGSGRAAAGVGAGLLAALAALGLGLDTLHHIFVYGFGEIYSDQFRQYRNIREAGMPFALFLPDNGHRQVLSNLLRWADMRAGLANQQALLWAGMLAMLLVWWRLLVLAWGERKRAPALAGALALIVSVFLFWAGSARVQYHGNEALQVHLVLLLMLIATTAIAAEQRSAWRAWALALGCAVLAMMSFATGVAVFAGLLALGVVLRRPWRQVLAAAGVSVACLLAYTFVLPGGDGVRNTISFQPLALLETAAVWIGAFPTSSWLALPVEGAFGAGPERVVETGLIGTWMSGSAAILRESFGWHSQLQAAEVAGFVGFGLLALFALRCWRAPQQAGPAERAGLGIALFAAALSALVAVGRLEYFRAHPEQMLADRFALYSALFWCALLVCAVARLKHGRSALAACLIAALALIWILPTQQIGGIWASHSARVMEARAAQAQSGVLLPGWPGFADLPDLPSVRDALDYYRQEELAMFRSARGRATGTRLADGLLQRADQQPAQVLRMLSATSLSAVLDSENELWHIEALVSARSGSEQGVVAVDAQSRVVGLGEFGFDYGRPLSARIGSVGLGFDLYLQSAWQACGPVRLYLTDADLTQLQRLELEGC